MPTLHEIAEAARADLMACALALDEAAAARGKYDLRRTLTAPLVQWKLLVARRHRTAAKKHLDRLHAELHDRASLGVNNADLWSALMRHVDSLALSRFLGTRELRAEDVVPARATVHILVTDVTELIALLDDLAWPDEEKLAPT